MIYLNIQLKLIVFSFIFGFFFAALLKKYNKYTSKIKTIYKVLVTIIMMLCLDSIYFFGIYIISNAIFHIYSLLSIILGIITYNIMKKIT